MHSKGTTKEVSQEVKAYYDKYSSGGAQSFSTRAVTIELDGSEERLTLAASVSTTVMEVKEMLAYAIMVEPIQMRIFRKLPTGRRVLQQDREEVASNIVVAGIPSLRRRSSRKYRHPLCIMGAGLGGLQTAIILKRRGREDFTIFDRCEDFGGSSWICVSNKYTKLQTERGTYHLDYILSGAEVPTRIDDIPYKTWPSRDALLTMFRAQAAKHGLREKTRFNTSIVKIQVQQNAKSQKAAAKASEDDEYDRTYMLHTVPVRVNKEEVKEIGDAELVMGSCCICWPGNLCKLNTIEFPGEDIFDGYIEYSSFDRFDYTRVATKNVILYGHGAFVIENVRTLLEHRAKKVFVMCRRRNICGMRAVSWMVGYEEQPVPGHIMLDAMQRMYDLVDWNVWTAHSVKTDAKHSFAYIEQKTVFGVTDIYFLAGYYGLMEVIVDEIKHLSYHSAHCLQSDRRLDDVECIVKAVGTLPDRKNDKLLNVKELVGIWVNGDPLMPVSTNGMYVAAKNFGSFSSGPGFVSIIGAMTWFVDFPEDMKIVGQHLPRQKAGERPAHIAGGPHAMSTFMVLHSMIPALAMEIASFDRLKAMKQRQTHPMKEYIAECKREWEMYIRNFKKYGMVDDREEPPYPYTVEIMEDYISQSRQHHMKNSTA